MRFVACVEALCGGYPQQRERFQVFRLGCFSYETPAPDTPASPLLVRKTPPTADDKQWLLDDVTGDPERA